MLLGSLKGTSKLQGQREYNFLKRPLILHGLSQENCDINRKRANAFRNLCSRSLYVDKNKKVLFQILRVPTEVQDLSDGSLYLQGDVPFYFLSVTDIRTLHILKYSL